MSLTLAAAADAESSGNLSIDAEPRGLDLPGRLNPIRLARRDEGGRLLHPSRDRGPTSHPAPRELRDFRQRREAGPSTSRSARPPGRRRVGTLCTASPAGAGLAFRGPSGGDWMVYLIVSAPRDAAVDLEAGNETYRGSRRLGPDHRADDERAHFHGGLLRAARRQRGERPDLPGALQRHGRGAGGGTGPINVPEPGYVSASTPRTAPFRWSSKATAGRGEAWTRTPSTGRSASRSRTVMPPGSAWKCQATVRSRARPRFAAPPASRGTRNPPRWSSGTPGSDPVVRLSTENGPVSVASAD